MQSTLRVLVPLDDSLAAQRVLPYVRFLVGATHGHLKLVRATDVEPEGFFSLKEIAWRLSDAGAESVDWSVLGGVDAETAILDTARTWEPHLIVMSTTKSFALQRWLDGSVSDAIVRSAVVPVMVVPADWEGVGRRGEKIRVLVPLDGSAQAERAVAPALRLATAARADLALVRAIKSEGERSGAEAYLQQIGDKALAALPRADVRTHVVSGSAAGAIASVAGETRADAIVIATRGHVGLTRLVRGSTATSLLQDAKVPLILIGPRVPDRSATG